MKPGKSQRSEYEKIVELQKKLLKGLKNDGNERQIRQFYSSISGTGF